MQEYVITVSCKKVSRALIHRDRHGGLCFSIFSSKQLIYKICMSVHCLCISHHLPSSINLSAEVSGVSLGDSGVSGLVVGKQVGDPVKSILESEALRHGA